MVLAAQSAPAQEEAKGVPLPRPNDALNLAVVDVLGQTDDCRCYLRYIWVMDGEQGSGQACSFAMNSISRGSVIKRPVMIGKDKLMLLRVDLRHYAPRDSDLRDFINTWEEFRFDPRFNLLLTKDTVKFALNSGIDPNQEVSRQYVDNDGKLHTINQKIGSFPFKDFPVLRAVPPHIDITLLGNLQRLCASAAPVVTHDYFIARSQASIRDAKLFEGLFDVLYGGRYADFVGLPRNTKGTTDLDQHFANLGVGNGKPNDFKRVFDTLRSDKRVAVFRSKVAGGRPRRIDFLPILAGSAFDNQRIFSLTHDLKRSNLDIGQHPIMNLIDINADAREGIWTLANGLNAYALWNGAGALQEKAPDDVVNDHTVPAPFYRELQYPISCRNCHEAEGSDGWKPVVNDVERLFKGLDVLTDLKGKHQQDVLDRIAGLYTGKPDQLLRRLKDDYAAATLRSTGPWKESPDQTDVVTIVGKRVQNIWRSYFYDDVTPQRALRELGWEIPTKDAERVISKLLGSVIEEQQFGFVPEDPRIAALKAGLPIGRYEFDQTYSFIANRVQKTLAKYPELLEKKK
jgi:hypothetical protein